MKKQRLAELGKPIQTLSCYTNQLVVILKNGIIRYIIYQKFMVDDPTEEMCFNALSKVHFLKVVIIN